MSANLKEAQIQAWETEDATVVVWGTHDPVLAAEVANAWYVQNYGEEGPEEDMVPEDFAADCHKMWGHPDCPELEVWDDAMWSRKPVEGFIPYLAVDR